MTAEWFKILEEIESPYRGKKSLEDQLHAMLIKADSFTPENEADFEAEKALLGKLLIAHRKHFEKNGLFGDLFGDYMIQAEKCNKGTGQVFTPCHVAKMMVEMTLGEADLQKPTCYYDPACGTGRFMLKTAEYYAEKTGKLNFLYVNTDIDYRAYVFCAMNAILNRIPAIVCWGDTLKMEYREAIVVLPQLGMVKWNRLDSEKTKEIILRLSGFKAAATTQKQQLMEAIA